MEDSEGTKVGYVYVLLRKRKNVWALRALNVICNEVFSYYGENVFKIGKTRDIAQRVSGYVTSYLKPV